MKKWIIIVLSYIALIGALIITLKDNNSVTEKWKRAEANVKAYDNMLSTSEGVSAAFELSAKQLSYAKDSILKELNDTRKQLKIKDKNLKALQNIKSTFQRNDTIILKDTIFKDPTLAIDTLIGDDWYRARIKLQYPSTIAFNPSFKSDKSIIVSMRKETVNPPKRLWILRLFQKKHKVITVDVIEKNPYATSQENRYVEIVK